MPVVTRPITLREERCARTIGLGSVWNAEALTPRLDIRKVRTDELGHPRPAGLEIAIPCVAKDGHTLHIGGRIDFAEHTGLC